MYTGMYVRYFARRQVHLSTSNTKVQLAYDEVYQTEMEEQGSLPIAFLTEPESAAAPSRPMSNILHGIHKLNEMKLI